MSKLAQNKKNLFIVTKHSDVMKAALGNTKIENIITDYESLLQYSHEKSCALTSLNKLRVVFL